MNIFKYSLLALTLAASANADEVSKKACETFLPALGEQNVGFVLNGVRRDLKEYEKSSKRFFEILKVVDDTVNDDTKKRCDAGMYPIMNPEVCYNKCKEEVEKRITGSFAWNYQDRWANIGRCNDVCTNAYVVQNGITRALRKVASEKTDCGPSTEVVDSRKSKQIENILLNIDAETGKNTSK